MFLRKILFLQKIYKELLKCSIMDHEKILLEIAPWTKNVLQKVKDLEGGKFMRGRSGWMSRGIKNPESIYEHSCKVALASWYLFGTRRALAEGLVHDFPEIYTQDYTPGEINPMVKREKEFAVMKMKLSKDLSNGNYWLDSWLKFEYGIGVGKYVKELDKICPVIQAIDYLKEYPNNKLEEFYSSARAKIKTPSLIKLLDRLWSNGVPKNENAYQSYFRELEKIRLRNEAKRLQIARR
jgi:5'-deoxynucleotidase YfbR-like HD superfamily hydrolase